MGGISIIHLIVFVIILLPLVALPIVAIWRILRRLGFEPALSLLYLLPFGSLIGLYIIAFSRWPGAAGSPAEDPSNRPG